MDFNKWLLVEKDLRILKFLTKEEMEKRVRLFNELIDLEKKAKQRYLDNLEENADKELNELAGKLPQTELQFKKGLHDKLRNLLKPYGRFALVIWDWEEPDYDKFTVGWKQVFNYEVETGSDFHCNILSEARLTHEEAQAIFDNFYSISNIKYTLGLNVGNEEVDKIVYEIARSLISVYYQ